MYNADAAQTDNRGSQTNARLASSLNRMLRRLVSAGLARAGYELRRREREPTVAYNAQLWSDQTRREFEEIYAIVRSHTMLSEARLFTLYRQAVWCERRRVPGAFVECGVWKGGSAALLAFANLRHGSTRRSIHLLDAFQDICEPDPELDRGLAVDQWRAATGGSAPEGKLDPVEGAYDPMGGHGTVEAVMEIMGKIGYPLVSISIHKGWFQDTVHEVKQALDTIALLHLDGDLYRSIQVCLEAFYPLVSSPGYVAVDDYGLYEGCTRAVDDYLKQHELEVFIEPTDYVMTCHGHWMKV